MSFASIDATQGLADCGKQRLAVEGFAKEPIALGYRPLLVCYFVTAGDKDDWQFRALPPNQLLQLEAIDERHSDVGDEAGNSRKNGFVLQEQLGGSERPDQMARRFQQLLQGFEQPGIIIDDRNGRASGVHQVFPARLE
jgi:hypothetical protein